MKKERGFTLIELMVALGIFAIVMTLVSGGYLLLIAVNREAQASATGVNNLSYALDTMARTIRTGTMYSCEPQSSYLTTPSVKDCSATAGSSLGVVDQNGKPTIFALSADKAITLNGTRITDTAITVDRLNFYVQGSTPRSNVLQDTQQPSVIIVVQGTVSQGPGKPSRTFNVQTTAVMRSIDL